MTLDEAMAEIRKQLDGAEQHARNIHPEVVDVRDRERLLALLRAIRHCARHDREVPTAVQAHRVDAHLRRGFHARVLAPDRDVVEQKAEPVTPRTVGHAFETRGRRPELRAAAGRPESTIWIAKPNAHTEQALKLAAEVSAADEPPSLLMGKQKVVFALQPTRSYPEGAPDRASYLFDDGFETDCQEYAREWCEVFTCSGCAGEPSNTISNHHADCPTIVTRDK